MHIYKTLMDLFPKLRVIKGLISHSVRHKVKVVIASTSDLNLKIPPALKVVQY